MPPFIGEFNGDGHVISNATINQPNDNDVGLFGFLTRQIKNLGVKNVNITGYSIVGGLCGINYQYGDIINSYSIGTVRGYTGVGGLCGDVRYGSAIINCYSNGTVMGSQWVGGLCGYVFGEVSISNSYSTCRVTGDSNVGGLVGGSSISYYSNNFWDIEASGTTNGVGDINPDPAGMMGRTTAQMQTLSTFTGWDFSDTWAICEGMNYPRFQWQIPAGDWLCPDGVALEDYGFLAGYWLLENCDAGNNDCQGTDLNNSGSVDLDDMLIFADNWLQGL